MNHVRRYIKYNVLATKVHGKANKWQMYLPIIEYNSFKTDFPDWPKY